MGTMGATDGNLIRGPTPPKTDHAEALGALVGGNALASDSAETASALIADWRRIFEPRPNREAHTQQRVVAKAPSSRMDFAELVQSRIFLITAGAIATYVGTAV